MGLKALLLRDTHLLTFNSKNQWIDTNIIFGNQTEQNFIDYGFDPTILNTSINAIYVDFNYNGKIGVEPDVGDLYVSNEIDKSLGITNIEYEEINTQPRLKLTVPSFLPKDYILPTDIILYYNDDVNFVPIIDTVTFSSNETHNDIITMKFNVIYNYNEKVKYRVKINELTSEWIGDFYPYANFSFNILPDTLVLGENDITIEVAILDELKIAQKFMDNAITLNNQQPNIAIISADSNNYKTHFIITDPDIGDTVQYQLTLTNNRIGTEIIVPWVPLINSYDVVYSFDSNYIEVNKINTLKIEYRDNFKEGGSTIYEFTGEYKNLMFADEINEYYTTDKGALLQLLSFGSMFSGQTSEVKKIIIRNKFDSPITQLKLNSLITKSETNDIVIELSKINNPFIPQVELDYGDEIINLGDSKEFYMRLVTGDNAVGLNEFEIEANALAII